MKDIFDYISEYGVYSFSEKKVNEVDILLFSQFSYANFTDVFNDYPNGLSLSDAWEKAKEKNKIATGIAHKNAIKILNLMSETVRYKDITLLNYKYIGGTITQFGAITVSIDDYNYVSFEGTDDSISGWRENFELMYKYPNKSQRLASAYLKELISWSKKKIVVCGHSKGGNLALVSVMELPFFQKSKIKSIYSFDGPGLMQSEFNSFSYKLIRNRLHNIIPNRSLVGVLLTQEKCTVIKSCAFDIMQHDPATWVVDGNMFLRTTQDSISIKLDEVLNTWLKKYDLESRERIINDLFSIFEKANIRNISDIKEKKLESYYTLLKNSFNLSSETKSVLFSVFELLVGNITSEVIKSGKEKIMTNINNFLPKTNGH